MLTSSIYDHQHRHQHRRHHHTPAKYAGMSCIPSSHSCLEAAEPALLVGETGTGKTTACQLAARARGQALLVVSCNQHTEAADFIGSFRPARERGAAVARFCAVVESAR